MQVKLFQHRVEVQSKFYSRLKSKSEPKNNKIFSETTLISVQC